MKRTTRIFSLTLTMVLISLFTVIPALALPPIPSSFYGTAKVNGVYVPDGTQVQALINGQVFAQAVTQTYQNTSVYSLDIPGDDANTPAVDGGHEGDTIQFKIDGKLASQTGVWHSGTNISLALTRLDVIIPTPIPTKQHQSPYLKSDVLTPTSLTTQDGTISGSSPSLNLLEQSGTQDDPAAYLSLQTPDGPYRGYQSFFLSTDTQTKLISTMLLQVNFKGPASSTQVWTWSVYDWSSKLWIKVGDSNGINPNEWESLVFRIRSPWKYISAGKEIRIQVQSNNANADAKIDYAALHVTYLSHPATATPVSSVVTPVRPGIFSAQTTPTPRP